MGNTQKGTVIIKEEKDKMEQKKTITTHYTIEEKEFKKLLGIKGELYSIYKSDRYIETGNNRRNTGKYIIHITATETEK